MASSFRILVVVALTFFAGLCHGADSPTDARPDVDAPAGNENGAQIQGPNPAKLFEAVSAYWEGLHPKASPNGKREPSRLRSSRKRPTVAGVSRKAPVEQDRAFDLHWELSQARMERGEWELAGLSLARSLASADNTIPQAEIAQVEHAAETAKAHASSGNLGPGKVAGEILNSIGMRMVVIEPGTFTMGSSLTEIRRIGETWAIPNPLVDPEGPAHEVRISRPYLLGKNDVTVRDFRRFAEETGYRTVAEKLGWGWVYDNDKKHWSKQRGASWQNPGTKVYDDYPVTMVCWKDAEAFCEWLGRKENREYYLPTEAQWEFAARGGLKEKRFSWGDEYPGGKQANLADRRSDLPWADKTVDDGYARMSPVGSYQPNGFWLYDILGNVWQLCQDYYDARAYRGLDNKTTVDPEGPKRGKKRVVRGGNWAFGPGIARNAFRFGLDPETPIDICGFRVAAVADITDHGGPKASPSSFESWQAGGEAFFLTAINQIRELVAKGQRQDARKLADTVIGSLEKKRSSIDAKAVIKAVLDAQIEATQDKGADSFTNSMEMKMVRIPAGAFVMGSSEIDISWAMGTLVQNQPISLENEAPFHKVRISRPFYIAANLTTVGQFRRFVEETGYVTDAEDAGGGRVFDTRDNRFMTKKGSSWRNPGWKVEDNQPVVMISHNDAVAFVEWLSGKEKVPYKLPTEAQWEYAARGGIPGGQFPWGDSRPDGRRANYADRNKDFEWRDRNADGGGYKQVAPVGTYEPNGYGLYDMAGNALQWVRDYYREDYYRYSPEIDPEGPDHAETRVMRGGDWTTGAVSLRCAFRGWAAPELACYNFGFRVAIEFASAVRPFHFSEQFLTKEWVPNAEDRQVAGAVAAAKQRPLDHPSEKPRGSTGPGDQGDLIMGVMVLDVSPGSEARKQGLAKGDVIIEYDGVGNLTSDKLLAVSARTRSAGARPSMMIVRNGVQFSVQVPPGALGITLLDTTIHTVKGSLKLPEAGPEPEPKPVRGRKQKREEKKKDSKPRDWT